MRAPLFLALLPGLALAQGYKPNISFSLKALDVERVTLGEDLSFRTLVLTKNEVGADTLVLLGGRLRLVPYEVNANAWIDFDVSTGFRVGNQLNIADGAFLTVDNISPKRSTETLSLYGAHGLRLVAQSSVDTCTSGLKGQLTTLTSDGQVYECDGTASYRFARVIVTTAALNFPSMDSLRAEVLTASVTGAAIGDPVKATPCDGFEEDIGDIQEWVSATNTVSIQVRNFDTIALDPAICTFTIEVTK